MKGKFKDDKERKDRRTERSNNIYSPHDSEHPTPLDLFSQALAPHMIIFRVTIGRSWLKPPGIDHCQTNGEQVSANLEFKHSIPGEMASATCSVRHLGHYSVKID
jgi:hypothetical protein